MYGGNIYIYIYNLAYFLILSNYVTFYCYYCFKMVYFMPLPMILHNDSYHIAFSNIRICTEHHHQLIINIRGF